MAEGRRRAAFSAGLAPERCAEGQAERGHLEEGGEGGEGGREGGEGGEEGGREGGREGGGGGREGGGGV